MGLYFRMKIDGDELGATEEEPGHPSDDRFPSPRFIGLQSQLLTYHLLSLTSRPHKRGPSSVCLLLTNLHCAFALNPPNMMLLKAPWSGGGDTPQLLHVVASQGCSVENIFIKNCKKRRAKV